MAGDDEVRIEEQDISNALGAWDTAAEQLKAGFQAKAHVALDKFNGANWAGGDSAGDAFRHAINVDQVNALIDQKGPGSEVVQAVVDLGTNTRDAINRSLSSDQVQATDLKKPQGKL